MTTYPGRWFLPQYSARKLAGNAQFSAGTWGKMAGICCRNSMTVSGCQNWSEPAGNGRNFTGNVHRTRMGKLRQEINGNSADQAGSGRTATTWVSQTAVEYDHRIRRPYTIEFFSCRILSNFLCFKLSFSYFTFISTAQLALSINFKLNYFLIFNFRLKLRTQQTVSINFEINYFIFFLLD